MSTLNYAPSHQPSIRLGRIALGAGALALGILLARVADILLTYSLRPHRAHLILYSIVSVPPVLGTTAACILFAAALPRRHNFLRVALCLCAALPLFLFALRVAIPPLALFLNPGNTVANNFDTLLLGISALSTLADLTTLAAQAAVLVIAARNFQRPALGILAACGLLPQFLVSFTLFAVFTIHLVSPTTATLSLYNAYAAAAAQIWTFFLWLAIALFATILTTRHPRPNDSMTP
jgi:hypothetical protein